MSVEFTRPSAEVDEGRLEVACDGAKCAASETFWGEQFHDAMREAKAGGWKNIPDGNGGYKNLCSACSASTIN